MTTAFESIPIKIGNNHDWASGKGYWEVYDDRFSAPYGSTVAHGGDKGIQLNCVDEVVLESGNLVTPEIMKLIEKAVKARGYNEDDEIEP